MSEPNPYEAPDPAGLPKPRPGSLNPFQHIGVYVLAVLVVLAFALIRAVIAAFNDWLIPKLPFHHP